VKNGLDMGFKKMLQRLTKLATIGAILSIVSTGAAAAGGIRVTVLDREGQPVPDVAVYVQGAEPNHAPAGTSAIMDQVDQRFIPHLLVVQTGTSVEFPNSDTVAHHVYSFSHPNHFKLPIYKGHAHSPVTFDESGLVVLGCNIHDHMLAYILVVDTPTFSTTNDNGVAILEAQSNEDTTVYIWGPRIRDGSENLSVMVEAGDLESAVTINLMKPLRAPHDEKSDALSWSEY
jgi:plastocyanin